MVDGENIEKMMVSIIMITYGHEKYIEEAINGVFMQQTDFPLELIITNDCSPDNTDEVVKKMLSTAPSNVTVKYTRHESNLGMMPNFIWSLKQSQGKYIAICEGDDYWTDPMKLQKQVGFLEENEEFVACGTYCDVLFNHGLDKRMPPSSEMQSFELDDVIENNRLPTLTLLMRNVVLNYNNVQDDITLLLELCKTKKKLALAPFNSAVYRYHGSGANSGKSRYQNTAHQFKVKYDFAKRYEIPSFTKRLKKYYFSMLLNEFLQLFKLRFHQFDFNIVKLCVRYYTKI